MIVSRRHHKCLKPHPYQDERYNGGRVCNRSGKDEGSVRCTVCGDSFPYSHSYAGGEAA